MMCRYMFSYDKGVFYGYVSASNNVLVYEIEDIQAMRDLIEAGHMEHIDDIDGLEDMLKQLKIIDEDDIVVLERQ